VPRGQHDGSLRPYSRFYRQETLRFYQVASQLYSRGLVDPVPDPLLFFSGSDGNRTRASGSVAKNSEDSLRLFLLRFISPNPLTGHCLGRKDSSYGHYLDAGTGGSASIIRWLRAGRNLSPVTSRIFTSPRQDRLWGPNYYPMGTGGSFPGSKVAGA
jgi:hypothetical protein